MEREPGGPLQNSNPQHLTGVNTPLKHYALKYNREGLLRLLKSLPLSYMIWNSRRQMVKASTCLTQSWHLEIQQAHDIAFGFREQTTPQWVWIRMRKYREFFPKGSLCPLCTDAQRSFAISFGRSMFSFVRDLGVVAVPVCQSPEIPLAPLPPRRGYWCWSTVCVAHIELNRRYLQSFLSGNLCYQGYCLNSILIALFRKSDVLTL